MLLVVSIVSTQWSSVQFSCSLCLTLCDPMDCSIPGIPVHRPRLEFTQTRVHWVRDAIQLSYPLSPTSPPSFNLSCIRVFSNESVLCIRWPKYWSFTQTRMKTQWRHFFSHDEDIFIDYFQYCIFKCISEEFSIKSNNGLLEISPSWERKNNHDGN